MRRTSCNSNYKTSHTAIPFQVFPRLSAAYCSQELSLPPNNLEDFACSYDRRALQLQQEFSLEEEWACRYDSLSGGQRRRVQLACALWSNPEVLVVDEPTNDVDASTRQAVLSALSCFGGIGIIISHDRELLDALCSQCLFMSGGTAVMRPGGYTQGAAQEGLERKTTLRLRESARREERRLAAEAQRRSQEASRSASMRSARHVDKHDSDAREKIHRAVLTGKDGIAGKLKSQMDKRLGKSEKKLGATRVEKRYGSNIWMTASSMQRKALVSLPESALPLGEHSLCVPHLTIGGREHIGLAGNNGLGKTTLVRRLVSLLSDDVTCTYIPQNPTSEEKLLALRKLSQLDAHSKGQVLSFVAQLNSDPDAFLRGDAISPGEMRKLMLALGSRDNPALIVMDEPTNHLDINSIEALEQALRTFPGALLLASHDTRLLEATTNILWQLDPEEDGNTRLRVVMS